VYFDTSTFPSYGKLSHQSVDDLHAGFRIEVNAEKEDPTDFALWKSAKPGEEYWQSPWGPGRPGWHIECSVMNLKFLGEEIDIHAGGRDLVFPHHENEIAQSEAHSGKQFARYWLHNGTLNINGEKMSKSLGNFITAREVLDKRPGRAVRYYLLSTQYRHPLNYTEEGMDQAVQAMERFDACLRNLSHRNVALDEVPGFARPDEGGVGEEKVLKTVESIRVDFVRAMDDDFNSADGITAIHEAVREANAYLLQPEVTKDGIEAFSSLIRELMNALGLAEKTDDKVEDEEILKLVQEREVARKNRDFARSDAIRDELLKRDILIEDTAHGSRWYRK
jgi:cysteinyl-tRNA synthetase